MPVNESMKSTYTWQRNLYSKGVRPNKLEDSRISHCLQILKESTREDYIGFYSYATKIFQRPSLCAQTQKCALCCFRCLELFRCLPCAFKDLHAPLYRPVIRFSSVLSGR
jgi:hypothetical protein